MPEFSSASHPAALRSDKSLVRGRRSLGDFDLIFASDGTYLLDGGAMFGVVPKVMWQRKTKPDADNRILLGLNTVVVRTGSAVVLIETGIGDKQSEKGRQIHQNQMQLPASLAAAGVRPEEVTHVVNTHLHFDHCGWNTTLQTDGSARATFPNARYFAHRGEVEHGRLQLDRDKVSYLEPNYEPLIASGQMTLVDKDSLRQNAGIVPGVWMEVFPGHTAQMMAIHVESAGQHACYIGDLYPTSKHLNPTWVMGYDLDPVRCIAERKRFLAKAVKDDWLVLFPHDHQTPAAKLRLDEKGKPVADPAFPELLHTRSDCSFLRRRHPDPRCPGRWLADNMEAG